MLNMKESIFKKIARFIKYNKLFALFIIIFFPFKINLLVIIIACWYGWKKSGKKLGKSIIKKSTLTFNKIIFQNVALLQFFMNVINKLLKTVLLKLFFQPKAENSSFLRSNLSLKFVLTYLVFLISFLLPERFWICNFTFNISFKSY